jgi:hypothetical protein
MRSHTSRLTEESKVAEPLTLRNSSKSGGCISSGGGAIVVVGSPIHEYPMVVRSESRQEEHAEEEIRPQSLDQIPMRSEPLDLEDTWREINILMTAN